MCGCESLWLCLYVISAVQSSSIISRNMIRMSTPSSPLTGEDTFPESEKVKNYLEDDGYQILQTLKLDENVLSRSSVSDNSKGNELPESLEIVQPERSKEVKDLEHFSEHFKDSEINDVPSVKELSSRYWDGYRNFSHDLFNSSMAGNPNPEFSIYKGFQDFSIWEILQKVYNCAWSAGFLSCLQESFSDCDSSESYLHFMNPRFPDFQEVEGFVKDHEKYDVAPGEGEGRKKLSKIFQSVLPLVMILKMTMLPALAIMALVSGKAFLMSLLSLGVALVAATFPSIGLSASKRNEIAAQSTIQIPPEHPPSYYWM